MRKIYGRIRYYIYYRFNCIFLIARQFWCWYWKINARMNELEKINENLEQIKELLIQENTMLNQSAYSSKGDKLPEL